MSLVLEKLVEEKVVGYSTEHHVVVKSVTNNRTGKTLFEFSILDNSLTLSNIRDKEREALYELAKLIQRVLGASNKKTTPEIRESFLTDIDCELNAKEDFDG